MSARRLFLNLAALLLGLFLGAYATLSSAATGVYGLAPTPAALTMGLARYETNDIIFVVALVVVWALGFMTGMKR